MIQTYIYWRLYLSLHRCIIIISCAPPTKDSMTRGGREVRIKGVTCCGVNPPSHRGVCLTNVYLSPFAPQQTQNICITFLQMTLTMTLGRRCTNVMQMLYVHSHHCVKIQECVCYTLRSSKTAKVTSFVFKPLTQING